MSSLSFAWKVPRGADKTCLHGELGEPFARAIEKRKQQKDASADPIKVACFDLDGCLIRPKNGRTWPSATDVYDFDMAFRGAFARVKQEYDDGACVAIITNQDQKDPNSKRLVTWKQKMGHIARAIDCPLLVLAAISRDGFRKPGRLMWDHGIVQSYVEAGGRREDVEPLHGSGTFFVGDAAGRVGDHSDTDRKWATNVGVAFYTPEEYFLGEKPRKYKLSGWKPQIDEQMDDKGTLPLHFFPEKTGKLDLVLFVGPPAAGKTTFFHEHFANRDYERVNQDTLKTAARCLAVARGHLRAGHSVVVDNTNRNVSTRAPYIALARELGSDVQIRCVYFTASEDLCAHNNFFRVRSGLQRPDEPRHLLPDIAISSFFRNVEVPTRAEGFDADVATVHWAFHGSDEARQRWLLQWN